jgi:hypothetical protein
MDLALREIPCRRNKKRLAMECFASRCILIGCEPLLVVSPY